MQHILTHNSTVTKNNEINAANDIQIDGPDLVVIITRLSINPPNKLFLAFSMLFLTILYTTICITNVARQNRNVIADNKNIIILRHNPIWCFALYPLIW
jgi:hypothetical protein